MGGLCVDEYSLKCTYNSFGYPVVRKSLADPSISSHYLIGSAV